MGEDEPVVLGVLGCALELGGGEELFQALEDGLCSALHHRGLCVHGDVEGPARRCGEGDPDEVCLKGEEARGFGVDREGARLRELFDHRVEGALVGDRDVVARGLVLLRGGGGDLLGEALEVEGAEEVSQGLDVWLCRTDRLEAWVEGDVGADRDEVQGEEEVVAVCLELLLGLALHLVDALEETLDGAELLDELGRALLTDALDAGDVVRGVTHDREHVDDVVGGRPELLLDLFEPLDDEVDLRLEDVVELRRLTYELHEVLVTGDEHDLGASGLCLASQGPEDVISLEPGDLEDRDAVGAHHLAHVVELADEVLGHLLAGGLVLGELLVTEGRAGRVEGDGDLFGGLGLEDPTQGHREAIGRAGRAALGVREAGAEHREVGPVGEGCAIEEEDAGHRGEGIAPGR